MKKPFQTDRDYIAELELSLKAAHELLDERYKQNVELSKEVVRLGGESPPWKLGGASLTLPRGDLDPVPCKKCGRKFAMPKGWSAPIVCEDCDPMMNGGHA